MIEFLIAYRPLFDVFLLHAGFAASQYVVLRAGVFSVATAGLAAIGAYLTAWLVVRAGVDPVLAVGAATVSGAVVSMLLSWPLARLRGVYQAIATLAFVQVVLSLNLYAERVTGGALGFNGIPKLVGTGLLLAAVVAVFYVLVTLGRTRIGRAFDVVREDEAVAVSLGVSVVGTQALAFGISGAIAGLFGGLESLHGYALSPNQYGFHFVITMLTYVVLGGRRSPWGPLVGTAVLVSLPELARPLADNRILIYGALMMAAIAWLPRGVIDAAIEGLHRRRAARADARVAEAAR